jgi:gluconate 2-dehydrogenase gamma chain
MLNRREMLHGVGLLLGGTLSASGIAAILGGCRPPATGTHVPRVLTSAQDELVATLAELIIPTTDTPGARAAQVNVYIDLMLADFYTSEERARFLAGLAETDGRARAAGGTSFVSIPPAEQIRLLEALQAEAGPRRSGRDAVQPFFHMLKELTVIGYYTSEIGATQELKYVHAAGKYDSDVPLEQIGRAYS